MAGSLVSRDGLEPMDPEEGIPDDAAVTVDLGEGPVAEGGTVFSPRPDGGVTVDLEPSPGGAFAPDAPAPEEGEHDENVAELLAMLPDGEEILQKIAEELLDLIEHDERSRQPWRDKFAEGMAALGLGKDDWKPPFQGAATVRYPLLFEAMVQYQARAIKELLPPGGPVKAKIVGAETPEKRDQGQRVEDHMNWQLTIRDKAHFPETEQMLVYQGFGGSAFKKVYYDPTCKYPISRFVSAEDVIVPYTAMNLETAPRITHKIPYHPNDMRRAMASGLFRRCDLAQPAQDDRGDQQVKDTIDEADSREATEPHEKDATHTVYEVGADYDVPLFEDPNDVPLPWLISIEKDSRKILAIRRNWKSGDPEKKRRTIWHHYKYLPGLGFYGFGLIHAIGNLDATATGIVRSLLDAGAFSTLQGGFKPKDVKVKGGELTLTPGVYKDVDLTAEELKTAFYTPTFKEPSEALFKLMGLIIEAGRRFASTTEAMTGDAPNTGPVGTTVALIEQGSMVYSAIHMRNHVAAAGEYQALAELNYEYLPPEYPYDVEGASRKVMKADYDGRIDIIPVSDPNIVSVAQRVALAGAVSQLDAQKPGVMDGREVVLLTLEALRLPKSTIDRLLPDPGKQIAHTDPVTENALLLMGKPIKAFPDQDHRSHIKVLVDFLQHPGFGGNPEAQKAIGPIALAHLGEHLAYLYREIYAAKAGIPLPALNESGAPGEPPVQQLPPAIENQIALMAAQSTQAIVDELGLGAFGGTGDPTAQAENMKAQAEIKRQDEAHAADERRKDEAFRNEQNRKVQDHFLQQEIAADAAASKVEREDDAHQRKLDRADLEHAQGMKHGEAEAAQAMEHRDAEAEQGRDIKEAGAMQDMELKSAAAPEGGGKAGPAQRARARTDGAAAGSGGGGDYFGLRDMRAAVKTLADVAQQGQTMQATMLQLMQTIAAQNQQTAQVLQALVETLGAEKEVVTNAQGDPIGVRTKKAPARPARK